MFWGQHCSWLSQHCTILLSLNRAALNQAKQCRTILLTTRSPPPTHTHTTLFHPVFNNFESVQGIENKRATPIGTFQVRVAAHVALRQSIAISDQ